MTSFAPGAEDEVSDAVALRYIKKGIAKAKTKKEHTALMVRMQKEADVEAEKQAKMIAIAKDKELKEDVRNLLDALLERVRLIESIDEAYRETFLEQFNVLFDAKEDAPVTADDNSEEHN